MNDRSPSEEAAPAAPGDRVEQYRILEELGRGGMGVVFRARDTDLGRDVALKCPWPRFASTPEHRTRFLREGRIDSRLSHPSIVPLFEVFESRGLPWMAMQLVDGHCLATVLENEGCLSAERVLRYGEHLASALKAAHDAGILHRDINPRNILVSSEDRALLTDFGLARYISPPPSDSEATTQTSAITGKGAIMGTPHYMAPEQILAKPIGKPTDIFCLGTVLYEMCTGHRAFSADGRSELLDMVLHREPAPVSRFTYEIPEALERIVRKCLAKRPEERYQDARDLLVDLRALRRTLGMPAREDETGDDPPPVPGWRLKFAVATAFVVLLAAFATWWLSVRHHASGTYPGNPVQVTSNAAWEGQPALSPDGQTIAYVSETAGGRDIFLGDVHGGQELRLTEDPAIDTNPTWFPDGKSIAFVSDRSGVLSVWKVGRYGGIPTLLVDRAEDPAVSPDGKRIAFSRPVESDELRIAVCPIENPAATKVITGDDDGRWYHRTPAWSPDGAWLCYAGHQDLWLVSSDGSRHRQLTLDGGTYGHPTWSTDGKRIYCDSARNGTNALWWIPVKGGDPVRFTMGSGHETYPDVARNGSAMVYATQSGSFDIVLRNTDTGTESRLGGIREEFMPAVAPDKSRIAFISERWGSLDLWVQPMVDGIPAGRARRLTSPPGKASHPVFSPDGTWIAYYRIDGPERDIWMLRADGSGIPVRLTRDPAADIHPCWSPDGRTIAFVSEREGGSSLWTVKPTAEGPAEPPTRLTGSGKTFLAPAWSPDGKTIACIGVDEGHGDVWLVGFPDGNARRITRGAEALRVRWDRGNASLLVSGTWGSERSSLRRLDLATGASIEIDPPVGFGFGIAVPTFDVSPDGEILTYTIEGKREGTIWSLNPVRGRF